MRPPDVAPSAAAAVGQPLDVDVLAAVAAEAPAMFELLTELVETPTLLGGEMPGQDVMRRAFAGLGLTAFDVPLDAAALAAHPGASPFSWDVSAKANVLADWLPPGPADGRSLILNGHIDVVSPEPASLWSGAPFAARRDGDWLYGRGSGDMKAGLAAIVGAVRGLQRMGLSPRANVQLQSVVEEECTGNGALACVMSGNTADAAILTEPTGGAVWTAQVGVLWFGVRVVGMPAHTGETARGANAIEASYAVIEALRGLETQLNVDRPALFAGVDHPINLNVGVIHGGDWASTVAGECVTSFRLAHYPGEHVADLARRVEATVETAAREHPLLREFTAEVLYDGFRCDGYSLAHDAPLVTALAGSATRVSGEQPPLFASTATTDARSFALYGDTPAVCFGPYAEGIHGVDERVYLPSVVSTAQTLALFIRDWCGVTTA